MRVTQRNLQNYLWAMVVSFPPNAPPGVAIAEFRTAREALNAEKLCKRFGLFSGSFQISFYVELLYKLQNYFINIKLGLNQDR